MFLCAITAHNLISQAKRSIASRRTLDFSTSSSIADTNTRPSSPSLPGDDTINDQAQDKDLPSSCKSSETK